MAVQGNSNQSTGTPQPSQGSGAGGSNPAPAQPPAQAPRIPQVPATISQRSKGPDRGNVGYRENRR